MATTTDDIKQDVADLQQASAAAVALITELSSGTQVTEEQLDNLHTALTQVTSDLNDAVTAATPAR